LLGGCSAAAERSNYQGISLTQMFSQEAATSCRYTRSSSSI
jgi:hypothetical protein